MKHTKSILFSLFVLASAANAVAAPCIPETLSYYKTNYGELNACTSGVLNFFSFDFSKLSSFGSVTANDIYVTPDPSQNTLLFNGILYHPPVARFKNMVRKSNLPKQYGII